jgi:exodeoxyribonuclease-3
MALKAEREFILVGDINIAHHKIDLKNWKSNQKNSGFLPEERAWMTQLLTDGGLVDVFRTLQPDRPEQLHVVEQPRPGLGQQRGLAAGLPPGHTRDRGQGPRRVHLPRPRFSDHAPLTIDYDFKL